MKIFSLVFLLLLTSHVQGEEFSYAEIAKRYPAVKLSDKQVRDATMQGECLVGLKALNFRQKTDFDPVAEWSNFRSVSLLEQFPPCQVLIMLEVAQKHVKAAHQEQ
ncbi:hypothetical protein QTP81_13450 [Alteromonas sp. ASW11-36]|uniref:DUF3718 domain-containing protein n=1 Tax=Alteromonas arenosi TaxID=3055817 RepID=A0ABT7SZL4_9ALTE|nr:hypothetical protein [Alteromonas sp. ASW11-36]MDM7861600.1 hypothetical protein [Alteromonas sp. ASW11-36]